MKAPILYRTSFYFSFAGKDYSVEYFHHGQTKQFTETIYRLQDGAVLSKKVIDYPDPSVANARQSLIDLLNKP